VRGGKEGSKTEANGKKLTKIDKTKDTLHEAQWFDVTLGSVRVTENEIFQGRNVASRTKMQLSEEWTEQALQDGNFTFTGKITAPFRLTAVGK
jgi:polynucleotide 5'-kinase involved in rRNA processing